MTIKVLGPAGRNSVVLAGRVPTPTELRALLTATSIRHDQELNTIEGNPR